MLAQVRSSFWKFGLTTGFVTALVLTLINTLWEWIANPGGIFRGAGGTHWQFVLDTAASWFIPTFLIVSAIAGLSHLLWTKIRKK